MTGAAALWTAFWLGLLTSVSPCPLATNLAAVSYVGGAGQRGRLLAAGAWYALGRTAAYTGLAFLLVGSVLSAPQASRWLQEHLNRYLGPALVLVGMALLGLLEFGALGRGMNAGLAERARRWGVAGAGVLGFAFALSFCPVSAALYFGSLLPLALREESRLAIPAAYGLGTAAPVVAFALVLALGAERLAAAFRTTAAFERPLRALTGLAILSIGIYLTLVHVWGVAPWGASP